jgi:hypothetical protein
MSYAKAEFLSPTRAAHLSKQARKLHRSGALTHAQLIIFDTLLWDARKPGSDRTTVSYTGLQKLARVCRQSVADAISAFERLGLLRRIKLKVLVLWANGGRKWQQRPNEYVFCCESTYETQYPKQEIQIKRIEPEYRESTQAQEGLAAIAAARMRRLGLA